MVMYYKEIWNRFLQELLLFQHNPIYTQKSLEQINFKKLCFKYIDIRSAMTIKYLNKVFMTTMKPYGGNA